MLAQSRHSLRGDGKATTRTALPPLAGGGFPPLNLEGWPIGTLVSSSPAAILELTHK
jgi:hypothetical protein